MFGDVPVRVRRLLVCLCQGEGEAKSVAVLAFGKGAAVVPELAYVMARYAALVPFGKVAALLSELLPVSGTQYASTVRSRTLRVGTEVVRANTAETAKTPSTAATGGSVVVGLEGGYVRNRHQAEGLHPRSPLGTSSPLFPQRWRKQRMRPLPRRDGLQLDGFRARHLARLASS